MLPLNSRTFGAHQNQSQLNPQSIFANISRFIRYYAKNIKIIKYYAEFNNSRHCRDNHRSCISFIHKCPINSI